MLCQLSYSGALAESDAGTLIAAPAPVNDSPGNDHKV